jgi:hypothetical protein
MRNLDGRMMGRTTGRMDGKEDRRTDGHHGYYYVGDGWKMEPKAGGLIPIQNDIVQGAI